MTSTRDTVHAFLVKNFYVGADGLSDGESLLDRGIVDSTGILEVVSFLEETFNIRIDDSELVPVNLDSVNGIVVFVENKKSHS